MVDVVTIRRAATALVAALFVLGALASIAQAEPTAPTPSTSPTTTTPATPTPTTAPPATAPTTTEPAPSSSEDRPASNDDECNGIKVPVVGTCIPTPGSLATDAAKDATSSFFSDMVDAVLAGFVWIMKYVLQLFMNVSVDVSGTQGAIQKMTALTSDLQGIALGLGLLIAVIAILYQRAMLSGDNAAPEAFGGLVRWAVASAMAAPILLAMSGASDALASWIFTSTAGPEGPTHVVDALDSALSGRDARLKTEDVISLALCLLGLLAYIELMIQLVLQKFWIIYAAVALPIAGATSVIGGGKTVFWALARLALAALMFKPIAAICFGVAFLQIRGMDSGGDVLVAVTLMVAPAFILPQLVALIGTNVSYAGTPMLRGTIRNTRAASGAVAGGLASFAGGFKAGAAGGGGRGSSGSSSGGERSSAKAVGSTSGSGSSAASPAPSSARLTGAAGVANKATSAGTSGTRTRAGAAPAPTTAGAAGGTGTRTTAGASDTKASSSTTSGEKRAANTNSATAPAGGRGTDSAGRRRSTNGDGSGETAAPTRNRGGRNSSRNAAASPNSDSRRRSTTDGNTPTPQTTQRPRRRTARSGTPRDSSFTRIV
ncbi:hypothetical protein [Nocardia vermiculata]|uniref:TrbL/VirB6 plasmid conjugal transfer protein n=1 Tax=Nocardia vermiculata TaxID=257274 RepID=A0A846Y369_9NOCA|nr:hypothetical protein [Nocardia vermiculata]NKY53956.1 hypothetical protein [Nocardia vermiculata]